MKTRTTVSTLILVLALAVSVLAQSETAKNEVATARDLSSSQPVISERPEPKQPENYHGPEIKPTIILKVIFRSTGKVTNIKFVKATPEGISKELVKDLTKRCIKAAREIKFTPATKDGYPVSMYMQLEYTFDLH